MKRYHVGARGGSIFFSLIITVLSVLATVAASIKLFGEPIIKIDNKLLLLWIVACIGSLFGIGCFIASIVLNVREHMALRGCQTKGIVKRINSMWTRSGNVYNLEIEFDNQFGEKCVSVIPIPRYTHDMYKVGENITVYVYGDYGTISKRR